MSFWRPFLRIVVEKTKDKNSLSTSEVLDFLYLSPAFAEDRRGLVRAGVDEYLQGHYALAVHIIIPQLESAVRHLVEQLGGPVRERGRHGGMNLKNLDKLFRDERLNAALKDRVTVYLRVLLSDQRGWNIRNYICHGMRPEAQIGSTIADRAFHALLLLGSIRVKEDVSDIEKEQAEKLSPRGRCCLNVGSRFDACPAHHAIDPGTESNRSTRTSEPGPPAPV